MRLLPVNATCPCGRLDAKRKPLLYSQCCGQWLDSEVPAPDAESLMRSRYSAFVLERRDYLLQTWHASQRPASVEFDTGVKWLGLDVRSHRGINASHAEVEFVARQKPTSGPAVRLHERSRFVLEAGRWYYVDGDMQ
jgi:SEC-C motif-containing protein